MCVKCVKNMYVVTCNIQRTFSSNNVSNHLVFSFFPPIIKRSLAQLVSSGNCVRPRVVNDFCDLCTDIVGDAEVQWSLPQCIFLLDGFWSLLYYVCNWIQRVFLCNTQMEECVPLQQLHLQLIGGQ